MSLGTGFGVSSPGGGTGNGAPGRSAYQVWLDAGNTGDVGVYLASLRGPAGQPADPAMVLDQIQQYAVGFSRDTAGHLVATFPNGGGSFVSGDVWAPAEAPPAVDWRGNLVAAFEGPFTDPALLTATSGAAAPLTLTGSDVPYANPDEAWFNRTTTGGLFRRGAKGALAGGIPPLSLRPGLGQTVLTVVIERVYFHGGAEEPLAALMAIGTGSLKWYVDIRKRTSGAYHLRAWRDLSALEPGADISEPDEGTVTLESAGGPLTRGGFFATGKRVVSMAFSADGGSVYLDGDEVFTGLDGEGITADRIDLSSFEGYAGYFVGGYHLHGAYLTTGMSAAAVDAMHAELAA